MSADAVIARRRAERERLLGLARQFVATLDSRLAMRAAVVFGSVARGDFNRWSDIDLLIVADRVPADHRRRLDAIGEWPPGVQPFVWTSEEWQVARRRGNPIAIEAVGSGVWLLGSREDLERG
jgi:hypothetical protein